MVDRGSLLVAYETGVGKTIVSIAAVEELIGNEEIDQAMIVVLPNLKYQWAQQIAKFTDVVTEEIQVKYEGSLQTLVVPTQDYCVIVDGTPAQRKKQYEAIKERNPDYVIIGYNTVVDDWNMVRRIKSACVVLDEVTAIKTFKAQRTKKIKRLKADYRFGLTATPIDNGKPEEIYSIMQWIDPDVLGRFDLYDKSYIVRNHFGGVLRYKNLPVLHTRLSQAMERKTIKDKDVAPFMPKVRQAKIMVTADAKTKKVYNLIARDLLKELKAAQQTGEHFDLFAHYHGDSISEHTQQGKIMAKMQALDMLLNHPRLLAISAMKYEESDRQRKAGVQKKNWPGSKYAYQLWQSGALDGMDHSPKLDRLLEEMEVALEFNSDNKLLVFSVNPDMLGIVQSHLSEGVAVQYHGRMNAAEKAASVARFTNDPDCRVFLSSHAGSHGTDLYMANYLFNYDHAYASGKQTQIDGRHQRASSDFEHVYIKDLLVEGSVEVRNFERLVLKSRIESAIVDGRGHDQKGRIENDVETLTDYLQHSSL